MELQEHQRGVIPGENEEKQPEEKKWPEKRRESLPVYRCEGLKINSIIQKRQISTILFWIFT